MTDTIDKAQLELKLVQLAGHARRGYKAKAAEILGVDRVTISRNLESPTDNFLNKLEDALAEKAKFEEANPKNEDPVVKEILEARLAKLERYRKGLSEEMLEAFLSGADWLATRRALGL